MRGRALASRGGAGGTQARGRGTSRSDLGQGDIMEMSRSSSPALNQISDSSGSYIEEHIDVDSETWTFIYNVRHPFTWTIRFRPSVEAPPLEADKSVRPFCLFQFFLVKLSGGV